MADTRILTMDMDKKCCKYGHKGVAPNGLCLKCITTEVRKRTKKGKGKQADG